jgi:hypothetical protein
MENKTSPINPVNKQGLDDLRNQIEYLESKIRQAELAASAKMDEAAPIRTIYKWRAPERIYSPKGRQWYVTVAFVTVIIVAYSALTGNYLLIVALIMLLMLLYALNTFPPKMLDLEITNKGIKMEDKIFTWNRIENFWVTERSEQYVLNINLFEGQVKRMILLVGEGDPNTIVTELVKRIDYINPGGTNQDIFTKLIEGKHIPITKFLDVFGESKKLGIETNKVKQ